MDIVLTILSVAVVAGAFSIKRLSDTIKSYSDSYGSEAGKIDAASKKLDQIELQVARTTELAEGIKSDISEKSEYRRVQRQKLEELCEHINIPSEIFIMGLRSGEEIGTLTIKPESNTVIERSILRAKVLTGLYFPTVIEDMNGYLLSVRMFIDKYESQPGAITIVDINKVSKECRALNSKLLSLSKSLAV